MERMTARDRLALTWIGEQYVARYDILKELLGGVGVRAMYKVIKRWRDSNLIEVEETLTGQHFVTLTTSGMNRVGLNYPQKRPNIHNVSHFHAIGAVRLWVERGNPGYRWISERELWAQNSKAKAMPDGKAVINGYPTVVEVELNRKSQAAWQEKMAELAATFPQERFAFFALPSIIKSYQAVISSSAVAARSTMFNLEEIGVKL